MQRRQAPSLRWQAARLASSTLLSSAAASPARHTGGAQAQAPSPHPPVPSRSPPRPRPLLTGVLQQRQRPAVELRGRPVLPAAELLVAGSAQGAGAAAPRRHPGGETGAVQRERGSGRRRRGRAQPRSLPAAERKGRRGCHGGGREAVRERPAPRRHGRGAAAEPAPVRTGGRLGGTELRWEAPRPHRARRDGGSEGSPGGAAPQLPGGAGSLPGSGGAGQVAVRAAMGFVIRRQTLPFRSPRSHFGLVLTSAVGPRLWHRRSPGALCVVPAVGARLPPLPAAGPRRSPRAASPLSPYRGRAAAAGGISPLPDPAPAPASASSPQQPCSGLRSETERAGPTSSFWLR